MGTTAMILLALAGLLPAPTSTLPAAATADSLRVTLVANAGVVLSDGGTTLLVDLPYEPGYSGYAVYDPGALRPTGTVVSVVTHHHRDHFLPALLMERDGWRVIGPASATAELPAARVLAGDSVAVGDFHVVAVPTPHTPDHRSYRVRWRGRVLHFTGDTESPAALAAGPRRDLLFVTPWLDCVAVGAGVALRAERTVAYHLRPGGGDRICSGAESAAPGASWTLRPSEAGG